MPPGEEEEDEEDDEGEDESSHPELPDGFDVEDEEAREIGGWLAGQRSDFLTVMSHFYRATVGRATTWRDRLDRTVNWSVIVVASLLTWAFSTRENPHGLLLVGMIVVLVFLTIEARRYRRYDVWRYQVRVLEENLFANALEPSGAEDEAWRPRLARELRDPSYKVPLREALARRLRRVYLPLLSILLVAWLVRLTILADPPASMVDAAAIWAVPGFVVVGIVAVFYGALVVLALWPMQRQAKGEVVEPDERPDEP